MMIKSNSVISKSEKKQRHDSYSSNSSTAKSTSTTQFETYLRMISAADKKKTLTRNQRRTFNSRPVTVEPKFLRQNTAGSQKDSVQLDDTNAEYNDTPYFNDDDLNENSPVGSEDEIDINDDKWDTDIEAEEEKPKDFSCKGIYIDACKKQNIIPASYFLRHMEDPVLNMKHYGLGAPGIKPLSAALITNTKVIKLDLSDNWLGSTGAEYISKMMKDNCYITELNLSDNHLGHSGAEKIAEMLKQNSTLTHLTLQGNNFDDCTAPIWADILGSPSRLEYLDLSHNEFGEASGKMFGPAISENTNIKHLILSWNNFSRKGAIAIAKGLQANIFMRKFEIAWNGFGQDGAKAFWKTLKENEVLEELDISNNRIATEGAVYIAKGLMANQSLKVLKIGMNPMESAGCYAIIKAIQKNPNIKLELIDFTDILVDKYFNEELESLKNLLPSVQIKTGSDEVKLKPKVRVHPIVKLRNYIEKHHIKLLDFFNKFDKDGSMSVSKEEFSQGIKELGINLQEEEIDRLIKDLDVDGDGEINYSELTDLMEQITGK